MLRFAIKFVVFLGVLAAADYSAAQFRVRSGGSQEDPENVFVSPQREIVQNLNRAKQLIADEQFAEAVRLLDAVLESAEDAFFQPDRKSAVHRSIKNEAQRLIGVMPSRGKELYRLNFGAKARRALDEAVASADAEGLAYVARRYFHTEAGYEAAFLLGLDHLNHGRPLAAALVLQRVLEECDETARFEPMLSLACAIGWIQAGLEGKAQDVLIKLKDSLPQQRLLIGGKEVAFFEEKSKAVDWLIGLAGRESVAATNGTNRWLMRRGNPSRTGVVSGGTPLMNLLWRVAAADDPALDDTIRQIRQLFAEHEQSYLPSFHPLVVDDVVLMRTARTLLAVDFETGKRLWESPVDDIWENLLGRNPPENLLKQPQWLIGLGQRLGDDGTYGTLSSDGRLVFSIEDLGFGAAASSGGRMIVVGARVIQNANPAACNRLAAHDLKTGKLKWHVGGPADQFALRLADTFFLGPPLPLMGQLYVLAEVKNEGVITLIVLDSATGNLLWQQPLAHSESNLSEDPLRRVAGISPSYADGVLVCPTAIGAVVAVDLATRSLLWGYRYRRDNDASQQMLMRLQGVIQPGQNEPVRWFDNCPIIADGRVLITPSDSSFLHCLNLSDGRVLWTEKQKDDLYVACVSGELVVLAGRSGMRSLRLSDGRPGWDGKVLPYPQESTLSGQGYFSGGKYFVPLSGAAIAILNVGTGQWEEVVRSRSGRVPGNLICYRGRVLSQSFEGVESYYLREAAEAEAVARLARNPDDPNALALKGEILLDRGNVAEAIDLLRRAYAADRDPRTRGLLVDAHIEGLRRHFAEYRPKIAEIEALCETPAELGAVHRVMAEGLQAAGEHVAAIDAYLRLLDSISDEQQLDQVGTGHYARRDRWALARLAMALSQVSADARRGFQQALEQRIETALKTNKPTELRKAFELLRLDPQAASARLAAARRLAENDRILEAESLLWSDVASSREEVAATAMAELAELLQRVGKPGDALLCARAVARRWPDVVCRDGLTGRQWAERFHPTEAGAEGEGNWPIGRVVVSSEKNKTARQPTYGRFPVRMLGSPSPFLQNRFIQFDQNQRTFTARDAEGRDLWKCSIGQPENIFFNRPSVDAVAHGHLMVVSLGFRLAAIDTLGAGGNKPGTLLWDHDMTVGMNLATSRGIPLQMWMAGPWMIQQFHSNRTNYRLNGVGPVTPRILCFQRLRTVYALDPLTGTILWSNSNLPLNSEIFGDDEYVFVLPSDQTEAVVLRALDGAIVGKRTVPRSSPGQNEYYHDARGARRYVPISVSCVAAFGRSMVLWRRENNQRILECFDPWEQKRIWGPLTFSERAQIDAADDRWAVVCEESDRKARIVVVSLEQGRVLGDNSMEVAGGFGSLWNASLRVFGDRLIVVTSNQPRSTPRNHNLQPLPGMAVHFQPWGFAFGFDTQGAPAWPAPVPIEGLYPAPLEPPGCPILFFAAQSYSQSGPNIVRQQIILQGIDKRTGRTVCSEKIEGTTAAFEIVANKAESSVDVRLQQNTVRLKLTDEPWPKEAETNTQNAQREQSKEKLTPGRALLKALRQALPEIVPAAEGADQLMAVPAADVEDAR